MLYISLFVFYSISIFVFSFFYNKLRKQNNILNNENTNLKNQLDNNNKENDKFIKDTLNIFEKMKLGLLGYRLDVNYSNKDFILLGNMFNDTMKKFDNDLEETLRVLTEFGNSNFNVEVNNKNSSGKTGTVLLGIKSLSNSISELIFMISNTANSLNKNIEILKKSSNELSISANNQAASLEETAAAIEEITSITRNNSENIHNMNNITNKVIDSVKEGNKLAEETFNSMEEINKEVRSIIDAITVIDSISFQTNILSLNAAVEAATAGEAGKGFAVVAGEVRNLASRSAEAAKEIRKIVSIASEKANKGKSISQNMISGYKILNENIEKTINITDNVFKGSKEQLIGIEQISDSINKLDLQTQRNANATSDINDMINEINDITNNLLIVSNKATYKKEAEKQVSNVDFTIQMNRLKLDHINFKNNNCKKLGEMKFWTVPNEHECNLGKWIDNVEKENVKFTKNSNWENLKKEHFNVHNIMQNIIKDNSENKVNLNEILKEKSVKLDEAINNVFNHIQTLKENI